MRALGSGEWNGWPLAGLTAAALCTVCTQVKSHSISHQTTYPRVFTCACDTCLPQSVKTDKELFQHKKILRKVCPEGDLRRKRFRKQAWAKRDSFILKYM